MSAAGALNSIADVTGVRVGNAHDAKLASGVTVLTADAPLTAAASVFGGGPGTREMDALALEGSVGMADAIVLSGGSAFGLDAATGVQSYLREQGRGFAVGAALVPIVPQAILFDLLNGGNKSWGRHSPYRDLAYEAAARANTTFDIGAAGAGFGAAVAKSSGERIRGGLGTASQCVTGVASHDAAVTVGALCAVNAAGSVTVGSTAHFWAAPFEIGAEFGGKGLPHPFPHDAAVPHMKYGSPANTTLCIVATDAILSRSECKRMATMAAAGMARAILPVFTPLDGDIVFAVSTGRIPLKDPFVSLGLLGAAAANTVARAITRGVFEAKGALPDGTLSYRDVFREGLS